MRQKSKYKKDFSYSHRVPLIKIIFYNRYEKLAKKIKYRRHWVTANCRYDVLGRVLVRSTFLCESSLYCIVLLTAMALLTESRKVSGQSVEIMIQWIYILQWPNFFSFSSLLLLSTYTRMHTVNIHSYITLSSMHSISSKCVFMGYLRTEKWLFSPFM